MEDDKVLRRVVARCHLGDWYFVKHILIYLCHLSLVTCHNVTWKSGILSNCHLALELFLFRFLLTLVKRNLDDRQFTSWIKEVNRLADS